MRASDDNPRILFFAARKIQRDYFSSLAHHLNQQHCASQVVYFKTLGWRGLFKFLSTTNSDVKAIVDLLVNEKKASSKGQSKSPSYWRAYRAIKEIEARWLMACYLQLLNSTKPSHVGIWNGLKFRQAVFHQAANKLGIKPLFFENGLLPGMTTVDTKGINYLNSMPRSPSAYEAYPDATTIGVPELNLGDTQNPPYLFVPFQVNTDSQIVQFSPNIKHMTQLFEWVVKANNQLAKPYKLVFKLHPACNTDYSELRDRVAANPLIEFSDEMTNKLIDDAYAVVTINSTVGIESLLANKKVITLGQAFYNLSPLVCQVNQMTDLEEALDNLGNWAPNQAFRAQFLNALLDYQVPGKWQDGTHDHLSTMSRRVIELCQQANPPR